MDKLLKYIKFDKKYVLFNVIIVLAGIITGALFITILNSNDKNITIDYIKQYILDIQTNDFNYIVSLKDILIKNYIYLLIIFILSFTAIAAIFNIIMLFYKSFLVGISISSFILVYKFKGILLSIIYVFPHQILYIIIYILLISLTLKLSFKIIINIYNKKDLSINNYFIRYLYIIIITLLFISIISLYEALIPKIIKLASTFL